MKRHPKVRARDGDGARGLEAPTIEINVDSQAARAKEEGRSGLQRSNWESFN